MNDLWNSPVLANLAKQINQEFAAKSSMKIGEIIKHPDGRLVEVVAGTYLDKTYGRISNWWTWRPLLLDGTLGPEESGYGW